MSTIEITGIAKGAKHLLRGNSGKALSKIVLCAREVGWCKDMSFPLIVERVGSVADVRSKLDMFDDVLCVMRWPPRGDP